MSYLLKYSPKRLSEIAGNPSAVEEIKRWGLEWMRGNPQKPLLAWGPTGTGKTASVRVLADELGFELVEFGGESERRGDNARKVLGGASVHSGLFGKVRLVLIDDVDAVSKEDSGFTEAVLGLLAEARQPIILTAIDLYERKISGIRNSCVKVQFKRINSGTLAKVLSRIAHEEKMEILDEEIGRIASRADGDLRSAINDLEARNFSSERNRKKNIFDSVRGMFRARSYLDGHRIPLEAEETHDMLKLWMDENIPLEYKSVEGQAFGFERLSKADVFDGRILGRQYWGYMKYSSDLFGAGISLGNPEKGGGFLIYSFPNYLRKMSESKARREIKRKIGEKLKKRLHGSRRRMWDYFALVKLQAGKGMCNVSEFYGLETDELAFVLGKTEAEVKKRIAEEEKEKTGGKAEEKAGKKIEAPENPASKKTRGRKKKIEDGKELEDKKEEKQKSQIIESEKTEVQSPGLKTEDPRPKNGNGKPALLSDFI